MIPRISPPFPSACTAGTFRPGIVALDYLQGALALLLLFCSTAVGVADTEGVVLVENGEAAATIVTGPDDGISKAYTFDYQHLTRIIPAKVLTESAKDLAGLLNEMGKIWDPAKMIKVVANASEAKTRYRILLGSAAIDEYGLQEEARGIPYYGYVYRVVGNDLLIFGSSSKGTANGIYGLLQDELGARWFGPQEHFTIVPQSDTVKVSGLDKKGEPSFPGRNLRTVAYIDRSAAYRWAHRRMRMAETLDEDEPFRNHSHNIPKIVNPVRYFDSHPEYFALRSGRRVKTAICAICYSNPDVVDIATQAALSYFRKDDRRQSFSLGIADASAICECQECAQLQPERVFAGSRVASDMYFHFVNEVARRVKQEFPDKYIGVIAYNDVTAPPLGKVEDNVYVVLVQDISEYFDSDYRRQDHDLVEAWEEKGVKLGFYYYTELAKLVPTYFPHLLAEELKDKHGKGFVEVSSESEPPSPWNGPMMYLQSRLLWDVDLDVDVSLDEYFTKLYGPAAASVAAMFDRFEEIHMRPRSGRFMGEHYNFTQFIPYTEEDLVKIRGFIDAAHAAIKGLGLKNSGPEERRLAYLTNGLRLFLDMLEGKVIAQKLRDIPEAIDDVETMMILDRLDRVNVLLTRHEKVYREAIIADETLSTRFRGDTVTPVREAWKGSLSSAAGETLVRLSTSVTEETVKLDSRVMDRLGKALDAYRADPVNDYLFSVNTGTAKLGPNLAANPGFEVIFGSGKQVAEGQEWRKGMPDGYSVTPNIKALGGLISTVENDEKAHPEFGKRSAVMRNTGAKAYLLADVRPVQPGRAYLVRVQTKLDLSEARIEAMPHVSMRVYWRGPKGVIKNPSFGSELRETGAWKQLETVAIPPQGADNLSVFLSVENLHGDAEVLFDNLSVQLIEEK